MLERVLYNRLLPVVESQRGLSDRQYGFRKARSTIDAIKIVPGLAEDAIHGKGSTGKYCIVVGYADDIALVVVAKHLEDAELYS